MGKILSGTFRVLRGGYVTSVKNYSLNALTLREVRYEVEVREELSDRTRGGLAAVKHTRGMVVSIRWQFA